MVHRMAAGYSIRCVRWSLRWERNTYHTWVTFLQHSMRKAAFGTAFNPSGAGRRDRLRFSTCLLKCSEIAVVYLGLNDKNQAMAWLEKAYAEGFNPGVLIRPCFDAIRSDPGSKTCSAAWD
jgi:hypothetical protein